MSKWNKRELTYSWVAKCPIFFYAFKGLKSKVRLYSLFQEYCGRKLKEQELSTLYYTCDYTCVEQMFQSFTSIATLKGRT